jgi:ABC-type antimicrobial peptide transport system permease subunit
MWPGADPLGRRLVVDMFGDWDVEVVGVTGPVRHHGLATEARAEVYVPYAQMPVPFSSLVVRGDLDERLVSGIRATVREVQPGATVSRATPMADLVDASIATQRMHAFVFGGLALLALVLAGVGTFGVASFRVAQERHEMGLRAVLGASPAELRLAVLLRTSRLLLLGLTLGFAGSVLLLRGLSSLLFGLAPTDLTTYGAVAGVLGALGLAAALLPAQQAARTDPMVAMREAG